MTIDEAIEALAEARDWVGGDAPLLMADGTPVVKFDVTDDNSLTHGPCVYVCDQPDDEDEEEGANSQESD